MRQSGPNPGLAGLVCGAVLLQVVIGLARAETLAPSNPASAPGAPGEVAREAGPFGGCEPIGLTASGELVFPLECKKAIKRSAESPVHPDASSSSAGKPVAAEAKPEPATDTAMAAPDPTAAETKPAPIVPASVAKAAPPASGATETTASAPQKPVAAATAMTAKAVSRLRRQAVAQATGAAHTAGRPAGKERGAIGATPEAPPKANSALVSVVKRLAMAKPSQPEPVNPVADDNPRLRTASLAPACTHYRSYNPVTRSYRGYDGHIYGCR